MTTTQIIVAVLNLVALGVSITAMVISYKANKEAEEAYRAIEQLNKEI